MAEESKEITRGIVQEGSLQEGLDGLTRYHVDLGFRIWATSPKEAMARVQKAMAHVLHYVEAVPDEALEELPTGGITGSNVTLDHDLGVKLFDSWVCNFGIRED